jgi:glutathione S-transferase
MKLYFTPGACSLSPHITLIETGLPFELVQVDLRAKTTKSGDNYLTICPKGYVPALQLDNGAMLTEGAIIVQYLADQVPEKNLVPRPGTFERYRVQEKLHFLATELHKAMSPLYNPKANEELKDSLKERLRLRVGVLAGDLGTRTYLAGDGFTVADGYAYYCLRSWQKHAAAELSAWPNLEAYFARLEARPSVKRALVEEGL